MFSTIQSDVPTRTKGSQPAVLDVAFEQSADEREVLEVHSRSFALASQLLPERIRDDVCRLYAWCRWCDNAVDDAPSKEIAKLRLQALRADVHAMYEGRKMSLPASEWLSELVQKYSIPRQLPLDLLDGMASDLEFRPFKNVAQLEHYCYQVAGVVGLMMCRVLGVTKTAALRHANRLGIAMQLTNIARDIAEDWDRGRCYLPTSWSDVALQDRKPSNTEIKPLVQRLLRLAESHYQAGQEGFRYLPLKTRLAIRVAASVYREIGAEIERNQFRVMSRRYSVSNIRKLLLVVAAASRQLVDHGTSHVRRLTQFPPFVREETMKSEFFYLAIFGLSMACVMSSVSFALVGINPKLESYQSLPWIYAAACACGAVVLRFWAHRISKNLDAARAVAQRTV